MFTGVLNSKHGDFQLFVTYDITRVHQVDVFTYLVMSSVCLHRSAG